MKTISSELIWFTLSSLCMLMCAGYAVNNNALPEVNLPGIFLPNLDTSSEGNDPQTQKPPKPCCLPSQWQGNVTSQVGWGSGGRATEDRREGRGFREQTATVYVDQDKKRIAGQVKCPNDTCGFIIVFNTDNTADNYFFSVGYKKCFHNKTDKAEFRKQCIPDNSTFEGSVNIGPAGKGLGVNVWKYHGVANQHGGNAGQPKVLVAGKAVVTPDQCIPVMFQDHGLIAVRRPRETSNQDENPEECDDMQETGSKRGHCRTIYFMGSSFFGNVEPSIKDPSVFNPPDYCKSVRAPGGSLKMGVDMEYPDIIDRFIVLQ